MALLVYHPGRFDERSFVLEEGTTVIGRATDCEISILDNGLSRRHSAIEILGGESFLVDLESKNGSFVNGVRVSREALRPGDLIRLGEVMFAFGVSELTDQDPTRVDPMPTLVMAMKSVALGDLRSRHGSAADRTKRRLGILLEVSRVLAGSEDADSLLEQILDLVFESFEVDRAAILLPDAATGHLAPFAARCRDGRDGPTYSRKIADYVFTHGVAAIFESPAMDPRLGASDSIVLQAITASQDPRQRNRHRARDRRPGVSPLLHDQAGRRRHGPRPLAQPRHRGRRPPRLDPPHDLSRPSHRGRDHFAEEAAGEPSSHESAANRRRVVPTGRPARRRDLPPTASGRCCIPCIRRAPTRSTRQG